MKKNKMDWIFQYLVSPKSISIKIIDKDGCKSSFFFL